MKENCGSHRLPTGTSYQSIYFTRVTLEDDGFYTIDGIRRDSRSSLPPMKGPLSKFEMIGDNKTKVSISINGKMRPDNNLIGDVVLTFQIENEDGSVYNIASFNAGNTGYGMMDNFGLLVGSKNKKNPSVYLFSGTGAPIFTKPSDINLNNYETGDILISNLGKIHKLSGFKLSPYSFSEQLALKNIISYFIRLQGYDPTVIVLNFSTNSDAAMSYSQTRNSLLSIRKQ